MSGKEFRRHLLSAGISFAGVNATVSPLSRILAAYLAFRTKLAAERGKVPYFRVSREK